MVGRGAAKNGSGFRFLWKKYLTDTGQKLHSSFSTATSGVITLSVGSLFSWGLYKLNNKVYDVTSIFKKNEFWNDKLAILSKLPTTLSELQSDVLSLKRDVLLLQALAGLQSSKQVKSHSDVESCKRSLRALIAERQCAPIVLLLARTALITLLEPVKERFPSMSYADIYQLAGVVAVEITGGPEISFHPGRKVKDKPPPPKVCLPQASQGVTHLRDVFGRLGFSDKDIVALSGAHNLVSMTQNSLLFDNSYFKELLSKKTKAPTDKALLEDPQFRLFIEKYAGDNDLFLQDYAEAHLKLSELGFAKE
ncbi:hypothetical protein HID58_084028 [Brassica napus]|uniref:Plant heme peroxidase family profile domain-containing protein n=1 Tax=Brassica napus TaxID=3708 RepID=A0ABQ7XIH5_BRANA|nr:hypothetical protein HID58_084028 [Brassica napus]